MCKRKKIDFEIDENNCFICTSHKGGKDKYPLISINGKLKRMSRFIYEECFGEIQKGMVVRHKCDNPKCINPEHLEIGTQKDNIHDMHERKRARGMFKKGSLSVKAKLDEIQVKEIREQLNKGVKSVDMAKKYNVHPNTIWAIKHNVNWVE